MTKEIEIKPVYKIILKKPSIVPVSGHRLSTTIGLSNFVNKINSKNITMLKAKSDTIKEIKNEKNLNSIKFDDYDINQINQDKTVRGLKTSKSIRQKNYLIVKEHFDEDKYEFIEEELFVRGEGYCFGEWALIYNQPRSASIYTLEDSIFFTLGEKPFKDSFLESINNYEFEKKKFALENFFPFQMIKDRQLSMYKNIVPINCEKNQIIFKEGDISDSIYLIYLGSFTLEKSYKNKKFKVLNLEKGSIVGLESLFEEEKKQYKCTLKISNGFDFGIVFKLKISNLRPYIVNEMKNSFQENYKLFLHSWKMLFKKIIFVNQSISIKFLKEGLEEGKNKLVFDNMDKEENIINIYKSYCDNLLDLQEKKNFEELFKQCFKKKDYENRKKDGSLRIFSSRQRTRIYDKDNEKNNNQDNINIIKYFKKYTKKPEYLQRKIKTAYPLRMKKQNYFNNINSNRNKSFKNDISIEINTQNEYINKKPLKTDYILINNWKQKDIENIKENIIKPKFPKALKKLHLKDSIVDYNYIKENKRFKIHNKNEINELNDNNKKNENLDLNIMNNNKIKSYLFKPKVNINLGISKLNQNIFNKLKEKSKKNIKFQYTNLKYGNIKSNNSQNKSNLKNGSNLSFLENKNLKTNLSYKKVIQSSRNVFKQKILLKGKNNVKKTLKRSFSQKMYDYFIEKSNNSTLINNKNKFSISKNKSEKNLFKNKNFGQIDSFSGNYSNLSRELNLNNVFSVSYFKNIKPINDFSNYKIFKKNKIFPPSPNEFKIAFNSGDFNIPLVSSFLSMKGYKNK